MNRFESKYFNTALIMDDALIELLLKKDYEYISVKDICLKAGVNRSTFYLHYETKDDLLKETIKYINKKFYDSFNNKKIDVNKIESLNELILVNKNYLVPYLNYIKQNEKIFKLMYDKPELFNSKENFQNMYDNIFQPILERFNVPKNEQIYIFEYYSKGVIAIILKWVSLSCKEDIDFVISMIEKCLNILVL